MLERVRPLAGPSETIALFAGHFWRCGCSTAAAAFLGGDRRILAMADYDAFDPRVLLADALAGGAEAIVVAFRGQGLESLDILALRRLAAQALTLDIRLVDTLVTGPPPLSLRQLGLL